MKKVPLIQFIVIKFLCVRKFDFVFRESVFLPWNKKKYGMN